MFFCFSFFPNTGTQRQILPPRTEGCLPHRRHAWGHPLVSRWALNPASAPQPKPALLGPGKEHGALPGPGHPGRSRRDPRAAQSGPDWVTAFVGSGVPVSPAAPPFYGTFSLPPNPGVIFAPLSLLCSAATGNFGRAGVENPGAINCKTPLSAHPPHSLFIIILFSIF